MNTLFDTFVLVAACVEAHPRHESGLSWLQKAKNKEIKLFVSAHSLLEVYSVLTSAPFNPRISPAIAKKMIKNNIANDAIIIPLTEFEYVDLIEMVSNLNLKGGIVYDAIQVKCAQKANVDQIVTFNPKDFLRLITDGSVKIISL